MTKLSTRLNRLESDRGRERDVTIEIHFGADRPRTERESSERGVIYTFHVTGPTPFRKLMVAHIPPKPDRLPGDLSARGIRIMKTIVWPRLTDRQRAITRRASAIWFPTSSEVWNSHGVPPDAIG